MGDTVIIEEKEDKPDTIVVVPAQKAKTEKEVVVTETTRIVERDAD